MKAYDYAFLGAIATTLLVTAGGIVLLSNGSSPVREVVVATAEESQPIEAEPSWTVMRVHGVVTDPSGAKLAGVRVRPEGELAPETLTDPRGLYELLLPV